MNQWVSAYTHAIGFHESMAYQWALSDATLAISGPIHSLPFHSCTSQRVINGFY